MGCFYSKEKPADTGVTNKKKAKGSGPLLGKDGKPVQSTWTQEWQETNWVEDTKGIWARNISDLSVHMDLPRLAKRFVIYNKEGERVNNTDDIEDGNKVELVKSHLVTLSRLLNDPEDFQASLDERYYEFVNKDGAGDISQQLLKFFNTVVSPSESKLDRLLRATHQKMVFPGFYSIKNRIQDTAQFKDKRGTWSIEVHLREHAVDIRHLKTQMSKFNTDFEFDWELLFRLNSNLDNVKEVRVSVVDYRTDESFPKDQAEAMRQIFDKYFPKIEDSEEPSSDEEEDDDDDDVLIKPITGNEESNKEEEEEEIGA